MKLNTVVTCALAAFAPVLCGSGSAQVGSALGQAAAVAQVPPAPQGPESASVAVTIKAMMVAGDLSVRPVPKRRFALFAAEDPVPVEVFTTDFSGSATISVAPGPYRIRSAEPLVFEGTSYSWDVEVTVGAGQPLVVELSNDNATAGPAKSSASDAPLTEVEVFKRYRSAVYKIVTDSGHGSGFLVDARGFVLTNHHVVRNSRYLAIKVDETRKHEAKLIASDDVNDLAVLWISPGVVAGTAPIPLTAEGEKQPDIGVGERVIAIGSPLDTEFILTSGIVSKVEEGALYSDVRINPGNSGGPLFDTRGRVVGITTFGLQGSIGPGVAGVIRTGAAAPLLRRAAENSTKLVPPPDRLLPIESAFRFPAARLKEYVMRRSFPPENYHVEVGPFDVQVLTPVLVAAQEVVHEKEAAEQKGKRSKGKAGVAYEPGKSFYEWRRYTGDYRPVVTIQAVPEITMTGGSAFAVLMLGPNVTKNYRFKTDFSRMVLRRGPTPVEPILPGRVQLAVSAEAGWDKLHDVQTWGSYEYPPEAFMPGKPLSIEVYEEGKPNPIRREISEKLQAMVWAHFEPYFQEFSNQVAGTSAPAPTPAPAEVAASDEAGVVAADAPELIQIVSVDGKEVVVRRKNGEKWVLELLSTCPTLPPVGGRAYVSFGPAESVMTVQGKGDCRLKTVSLRD